MHSIIDLTGLSSVTAHEVKEAIPGSPVVGSIIVQARQGSNAVTVVLPRQLALALHTGLDPWVRAITEETDNGPSPSVN